MSSSFSHFQINEYVMVIIEKSFSTVLCFGRYWIGLFNVKGTMKHCSICGKTNEDHERNCRFCGAKLPGAPQDGGPNIPKIEPGHILGGRYRIMTKVGKGGMGYVYAAEEEYLGIKRNVAIKILPPQLMMDEGLMARFREEIKIAASLDHPNVVPIYSLGEHHGVYFYVMKLLDGQTAAQVLRQKGPFSDEQIRQTIIPIAKALDYAHSKGVVHRDVKSNNIHIGLDGNVSLMDFGIARMGESREITLPGQIMGTAEYMSPEQWYGEVDARGDIYSLGVVMYELACGEYPFCSKNPFELMKMHQEQEPVPPGQLAPDISDELESIILRCLEKDPADRFASAMALADELKKTPQPRSAEKPVNGKYAIQAPEQEQRSQAKTSSTAVRLEPPSDISKADKRIWEICQQADEAFSHGSLDRAIQLIERAKKSAPGRTDVIRREKHFKNVIKLIDQTIENTDRSFNKGHPQKAADDYEKVLQIHPIPAVAAKLSMARERIQEAKQLYARVRFLSDKGKTRKALKLLSKVEKLDAEAGNLADRRAMLTSKKRKLHARQKKRRKKSFINGKHVAWALFFCMIAAVVFGARPALLYSADQAYMQQDAQHWFVSNYSAYVLYHYCKKLGCKEEFIDTRLEEIDREALDHYIQLGMSAEKDKDLASAIKWFKKALQHKPGNYKLIDKITLLEAKHEVQQSLKKL